MVECMPFFFPVWNGQLENCFFVANALFLKFSLFIFLCVFFFCLLSTYLKYRQIFRLQVMPIPLSTYSSICVVAVIVYMK